MTISIQFKTLSLQDALDLAILIEEEACERYQEFSKNVGSRYEGDAGDFFKKMAENENKHKMQLSEKRKSLFGNAPSRVDASLIWDVEAPAQGKPRTYMSTRQALAVAMESEVKAYAFFDEALKQITQKETRDLFIHLRNEEAEHKNALEKQLALLPESDGADISDDEIDEPPAL